MTLEKNFLENYLKNIRNKDLSLFATIFKYLIIYLTELYYYIYLTKIYGFLLLGLGWVGCESFVGDALWLHYGKS
jgi:hypothetical protein